MDETRMSYGKRYAWTLVGIFTTLSVVLNAAHAALELGDRSPLERWLAALVAVVAPVSLLLATELVVRLIRDWRRRRQWLTALRGVCAATTAGIAIIAFATSAVALTRMAALMGVTPGLAWALPAVVDAMIVISTLAVVVAEAEMALDRADGLGDRPANHPVTHPVVVADRPVAAVADRLAPTPGDEVVAVPLSQFTGTGSTDHPPIPAPADEVGITHPPVVADRPAPTPGDGGGSPTTEVGDLPVDHPVTHQVVVDDRPVTHPVTTDLATRVVAATGTTKPLDDVERALAMAADGASQRAIADAVGADRTVVRKWLRAADEVERPELEVVR